MFESAELGHTVSKEDYGERLPRLRLELLKLQRELEGRDFPVIILINGVDGAGKGEVIHRLNEWLDARFVETSAFAAPTEDERERPPSWRFWMALPPKGRMAIFFGSWYSQPILDRVYGETDDLELERDVQRIAAMERMLVDDGALIVKFWLHLSKKDQKARLKKLESKKKTRWRVTKEDWRNHKRYKAFRGVCERVLQGTSTGAAPWRVVEGSDKRYRALTVGETLAEAMKLRLARAPREPGKPEPKPEQPLRKTVLDRVDLTRSLERDEYETRLEALQGRLGRLSRDLPDKKRGLLLVLEGWDAGGKGGAIRRMVSALDMRRVKLIPVAKPTDEEAARHYLWRFWRHLPRRGFVTIYDRSWYGRVLVERVEGFADRAAWSRAYSEINDFEDRLTEHGLILEKFWLHIGKDEQERRFLERQETPWKQHKLTDEDWRNREKWDQYLLAADDMISRTSTSTAPWTLVEGNDKRHARVRILETVVNRLEREL